MTGFAKFIKTCRAGDNPAGDFIRDARLDADLPDAKTWDELKSYLTCSQQFHASQAAVNAAHKTWTRFKRLQRKIANA